MSDMTAEGLTEAERFVLVRHGVTEGAIDSVERILADRLAAVQAERDGLRERAWDDGVRQAMTWLRADYEYGSGPDWRERGVEWISARLAEHSRAALDADRSTDPSAGSERA